MARVITPSTDITHSILVRVAHWLTVLSAGCLLVSGMAILLAHPRLYWGETGALGMPSLLDLPLPFVLSGQSGWGRSLHFLSAWVCVLTGCVYAMAGLARHHFSVNLRRYQPVQRMAYLAVIFGLFPLMIWTGLAMSPALAAVFPPIVTALGGQQSARTIHFFSTAVLLLFLVAHIAMLWNAGIVSRVRAMTIGGQPGVSR
jgi:thiosulfate reductase cytochrome b subunit